MICDSSDPDYYTQPANTPVLIRNMIINQYRDWRGGRCPEASGYKNWVAYVNTYAWKIWEGQGNKGVPDEMTYIEAYRLNTQPAILNAAEESGERTQKGIDAANHHCQVAATEKYGKTAKAEYVMNSGNQCIVTVS